MTILIQQSKDNTCVAAVLAMIVNESEQYVLDWFAHKNPPFCDDDLIIFLAHHGVYLAVCGILEDENENGVNISDYNTLEIQYNISTCYAYLVVESFSKKELCHAVLLKEGVIYDPLHASVQKLSNYKVKYFYPLLIAQNREPIARLIKN